ncbi:MAG: serine/threonine-protein kinase [Gemmataceae bacterium]
MRSKIIVDPGTATANDSAKGVDLAGLARVTAPKLDFPSDRQASATHSTPLPDPLSLDSFLSQSTIPSDQFCEEIVRKIALPQHPHGYTVIERIGSGGMAVVYRASQHGTNRQCAIKYVDRFLNPGSVQRLEREVRAIASIDHPNVIKIIECNLTDSIPNFVMEFAGGGTLAELIDQSSGGLPINDAVAITETVARVMIKAHEKGLIHRDLKPGNVLLDSSGEIKIADFGLARNLETDPIITKSGAIIGTPCFMSPEQAAGMNATKASDIYGTGAILYNLLTGRPPFRQADHMRTIEAVIRNEPVPPRDYRSEIPAELEAICLKAMQKIPSERYLSIRELADDLDRFRRDMPTQARPQTFASRLWKRIRKQKQVLATTGVIFLAVALALIVWPERPRKRISQEELTRKLRAGKAVTIVNESELLVEPFWIFEAAELKKPHGIKEFSVLSNGAAGLGLIRDPGVDSYQITCQLRLHQTASYLDPSLKRPKRFDRLGIMLGCREQTLKQATAHLSTCLSYSEFFAQPTEPNAIHLNNMLNHMEMSQMAYLSQPLHPGRLSQSNMVRLAITPPTSPVAQWREIVIEVNSKQIVFHQDLQSLTISSEEVEHSQNQLLESIYQEEQTIPQQFFSWSPKQEIGLWISDSWCGIRNFEIHPIPSDD